MSAIPDFLSLLTTLVVIGLVGAAVMKVFQIASNIEQMKEILKDISGGMNQATLGAASNVIAREAYSHQQQYAAPPAAPAPPVPAPYEPSAGVSALAAALPQPEATHSIAAAPVPPPPAPVPAPASASPTPEQQVWPASPGMNFTRPPTAEELVRAIHEQDFRGDKFPV